MNHSITRYIMGRVYGVFALLLLLPLFVSLLYREPIDDIEAWLVTIGISVLLFLIFGRKEPTDTTFFAREGLVMCALLWLSLSLLGGLPLYLTGQYPSLVDAFFEISSGLTTTGASVAVNIESLSYSVLFWRSFTHLIGGMGVLVFVLALTPHASSSSVQIAKAEMPGPSFGKLVAKLSDTARILYGIYLFLTAILVIFLLIGGMPLFDALCHAFGTAGTGGFGIKNTSIAYYHSAYLEWVLAIGMLVFTVNINLYYFVLIGRAKEMFDDEEFRWFLGFFVALFAALTISQFCQPHQLGMFATIRHSFFSLSSLMSTTGFCTVDFAQWPLFSRFILLLAMIIGGCGGSTAGGFKVSRMAITIKSAFRTLTHTRHPRRIVPLQFDHKPVDASFLRQLHGYLAMYILCAFGLILIVSLDPVADSMETAISTVLATFNNVGPGLGYLVGPTGNYYGYHALTKIMLSIGMIAGRLEIWPVLILFSPRTWKKH